MAVCTLHATQETGLARNIDRAPGLALATQIARADLVRTIGPRTSIEAGRGQFGGRIDLNGCWRHGAQPALSREYERGGRWVRYGAAKKCRAVSEKADLLGPEGEG